MQKNVCLFGASGSLGKSVHNELLNSNINVIPISSSDNSPGFVSTKDPKWIKKLNEIKKIDGAIWAQGINQNDSVLDFNSEIFTQHLDANLSYIVNTLDELLTNKLLNTGSRLVILSSVWQEYSRKNKLSYTVSKSALRGLVSSLTLDLGSLGISVNAVLPGVIDTPMTRAALSESQISNVIAETPLQSLARDEDVARLTRWLISDDSIGVNGQFITIDNGWSRFRNV